MEQSSTSQSDLLAENAALAAENERLRRQEAVQSLKNVMAVLGFYRTGYYAEGMSINGPGQLRL